ncbi:DUF7344 domain-containing protein [Halalkalirubrum salinum]|uniref:DUF7344 domain-containing protein n=1 Tax=Halalkalirubrum salinum TaxID=2563889 RepID=UPI0010FBBB20|nr:hypothetical protein [Halalkalirubrum salinum]
MGLKTVETISLPQFKVYEILGNRRRFETVRVLEDAGGSVSVAELSEAIAEAEADGEPPSKSARDSVYSSLHQTHLPKLHELGIIHYNRDARTVKPLDRARDLSRYMEVVTYFGLTWGEYYRAVGVLGLLTVLASLLEVPIFVLIDPILLCSIVLGIYAISSAHQLWSHPMEFRVRDLWRR